MLTKEHPVIERILVVSSNQTKGTEICQNLHKLSYDAVAAINSVDAVMTFKSFVPQIVLLDLDDLESDEILLRDVFNTIPKGKEVPVVGLSDFVDKRVLNVALKAGVADVLPSPPHWESFEYRLNQILCSVKTTKTLQLSQSRLATAQRLAQLGNWEQHFNPDRFICSHEAERILGLQPVDSPYTSRDIRRRIHPEDFERIRYAYQSALKGEGKYCSEYRVVHDDENTRQVCVKGELRFNTETGLAYISGTVQDVTERRKHEARIRHLAYYDGLTQLPNKQLFKEQFEQNILLSERYGLKCALLFVDLDQFKRINDSLGHELGDELLQLTAKRLQDCIRKSDSISGRLNNRWMELARIGGDEFIIMLPNIEEPSDAEAVAKRLMEELSAPYEIKGKEFVVTASIGLACYPHDGRDFASLMKNADTAVHAAKREGRSSFQSYMPEMSRRTEKKLHLENELRKAIDAEQLILMYQPQVDAPQNKMVGVEALVRWVHPKDGIISPADFIPLAEETGLVTALGRWVLEEACRQLSEWRTKGQRNIKMSVNVSPKELHCITFVDHVRDVLNKYSLDPHLLQLEMTEGALMGDLEDIVSRLSNIKDLGVRISIDDFGTGYSSLGHLKRYPIDVLIKTIIGMARTLKLGLVAEGVETKEQLEFLERQGTHIIQGFYFSKPLSPEATEDFQSILDKKAVISEAFVEPA